MVGGADDCSTLYRLYAEPLRRYFVSGGLEPQEAENTLQDLFLVIHKRVKRDSAYIQRIREPRRWLFGAARHVLFAKLKARRPAGPNGQLDEVEAKPDCRVEDEDEREFVRRSVRKLPRSLRVPLLLKWWRDWSYARIAARLKLTEGAVAMRIHRAYARLKEILRPPDRE